MSEEHKNCKYRFKGKSCEDCPLNCKFKRLQEENKELRQIRKNSPDIQEPYIYLYRQIKKQCHKLEEENEELKERLKTLDDEALTIEITPDEFERYKKYKQALEEIREIISGNYEILDPQAKQDVKKLIDEVLS